MAVPCARGQRPWHPPGTNGPQDRLSPGSACIERVVTRLSGTFEKLSASEPTHNVLVNPPAGLALHVLGPVRLCRDGRPLALGTRKVQALLVVLVLDGGASRERLCALLWPGLDEPAARRNLRRELARLREAGAPEAVRADGDHLWPGPGLSCDLLQAEAALAQAAPEAALAAWHGEFAEGFHADGTPDFVPWLAAARERAGRLRLRTLEAAAAAAEARGDRLTALVHVQTLLAEDGLQERHHREAMRLLAANGQRENALRQFDVCQSLLAAELGLQPMAETVALARALRGEADPGAALAPLSLASAAPPAVPLPPNWLAQLPFVGRHADVARLQAGWTARSPLLVSGEAGVGKTRLAVDFAAAQGPYALVRCRPSDRETAFGAFARALRVLAGQPPDLRGLPAWVVTELARLLPELGPASPPLQTHGERLRFDEACLQAWCALAADSFDTIVLDDWHHADADSRALLARVAARRREQAGSGPIELLVCRDEDLPGLQALRETLDAVPVALQTLPPAAVYELVQRLSGAADPARFTDRLARATGGNAYFIAETLRDLAESALLAVDTDGRWRTPFDDVTQDYHELPMATSVRDAVLARVRRLGAGASRLLDAAALAGEPFGAALLASACAMSELDAVTALDQAAQAQLVRAHEEGGYGWGHDLARQALESALAPARRRLMHHRLALAAQALGAHPAAALHFEACGEAARAVPHRLAAGNAALALQALVEAARHWRLGLADQPAAAEHAALLARLCETEWKLGRPDQAQSCHERLQALLGGDTLQPMLHADLQVRLARYLVSSGRSQVALDLLDGSIAPPGDAQRLPWLLARVGALRQLGRVDEARTNGAESLLLTPPATRARAELLGSLATIEQASGHPQAALARAAECVALYTRLGDGLGQAQGLVFRGCFASETGDYSAAERDLRDAATLAARFGNVPLQRVAVYNLACNFSAQTRPDEALAALREGWPLADGAGGEEIKVMFRSLFIESHYVRGEWGLVWEHASHALGEVLAIAQPLSMIGVANAALEPLAVLGQWPQALPLVQALAGGLLDELAGGHEIWLACAQAALLQGDANAAAHWLARLRPLAELEQPRVRCRVLLLRVEQSLAVGQGADALSVLPTDDALGMNDELRLRALALRCAAAARADQPALQARARLALADPRAHAGAALQLERALGGVGLQTRVGQLAEGLNAWPQVQASFRATWLV